jgi:hypothetical protein
MLTALFRRRRARLQPEAFVASKVPRRLPPPVRRWLTIDDPGDSKSPKASPATLKSQAY